MTTIAGELIFDRIFDRHDVPHQVLVHPLKERCDGGGFPGAGGSGHKNQAVFASRPAGQQPLRRSERFQTRHARLDAAQHRTEPAHGAVQVYAIARVRVRDEAAVAIHVAVAVRVSTAGLPKGHHLR